MAGDDTLSLLLLWADALPRPGWQQMAIDEALLDLARDDGATVMRLYRWDAGTISLGAHEGATRSWSRPLIEAANVPVVRRPTGGRAVWHDVSDLTYALTRPLSPGIGIRDVYRTIHGELATALSLAGRSIALADASRPVPGLTGGACFDTAVSGEVLMDGRKVIGGAQLVRGSALLQHGAIARADPLERLIPFSLRGDVVRVGEARDMLPDRDAISDAIVARWLDLGFEFAPHPFTERVMAASLHYVSRFRDPIWTWRR